MMQAEKIKFAVLLMCTLLAGACEKSKINMPQLDTGLLTNQISHLADSLNAQVGVSCFDLETGQQYDFHARTMMHAASTMKVPVMVEVFRQVDAGNLQLDNRLAVKNEFYSIVDSSRFSLDIDRDGGESLYDALGTKVSLATLVDDMIIHSSNLATNLLIELVDAKKVTASMRALGADTIQVLRGVEDIKAFRKGWSNYTNAYDLRVILTAIANGTAASPESCEKMIEIMSRQAYRKKIPAGLPDSVRVANKTGSITAISHDCAIVFPPNRKPYVLVVLTKGIAKPEQAEKAIAQISRSIYHQLQSQSASSPSP